MSIATRRFMAFGLAFSVFTFGLSALTGTEIAQSAHDIDKATTSHAAVRMELVDADGTVDARMIEEWSMEEGDLSSTLMIFRSPASVADTRFLQKENDARADDKWIYLPALRRVRRIASSDGHKAFMGTDFSYDDMETREVERDTHELIGEEQVGSWDCYVVKGVAVDPSDSQYSHRITWFDKETFVPVKIELFDKDGELLKRMEVQELEQIDGFWTPMNAVMTNVQTSHSTRVTLLKMVYDENVDSRMFTTSFLEQGR